LEIVKQVRESCDDVPFCLSDAEEDIIKFLQSPTADNRLILQTFQTLNLIARYIYKKQHENWPLTCVKMKHSTSPLVVGLDNGDTVADKTLP